MNHDGTFSPGDLVALASDRDGVRSAQHAKMIIPYSLLDGTLLTGKGRKIGRIHIPRTIISETD